MSRAWFALWVVACLCLGLLFVAPFPESEEATKKPVAQKVSYKGWRGLAGQAGTTTAAPAPITEPPVPVTEPPTTAPTTIARSAPIEAEDGPLVGYDGAPVDTGSGGWEASWFGTGPDGFYVAQSMSSPSWEPGTRLQVCNGNSCINVTVNDVCAGCHSRKVDLSVEAFRQLAPTSQGIIYGLTIAEV